jgi:hypothetical protein
MPSRARASTRRGSGIGRASRGGERRASQQQVVAGIDVEAEWAAELEVRRPDGEGFGPMGRPARGPEGRLDERRGRHEQRVRALAVAIGDERDDAAQVQLCGALSNVAAGVDELRNGSRRDRRQVGRQDEDGGRSASHRERPTGLDRRVEARHPLDEPDRPVGLRDPGSAGIERDDDRALDRRRIARRDERAPEHLGHESGSVVRIEVLAEPGLRGPKAPDRHDCPGPCEVRPCR